ncbi:hypothetical protein CMT41_01440 [Colwellia sp. MT41]|uniref:hypothetical protein n=1 Tax=Colwellia sp. MT41 TaxID=58049 RepID=UPI0007176BD8|nr:hypothetical protein [Colwellia sp. MT41]ALO33531.1 hypothetical protein CMT41_01440 [Colwellia sp. MT41]
MTTNKTDKNTNNLPGKQVLEQDSKIANKSFYQYFTVYFLAIFLLVVAALSSALWFASQQAKQSHALITEQLLPLQNQFLQLTYLINANKLIDEILLNANADKLMPLQQQLSLQSKKLSLLQSQYKNTYQQWFSKNNVVTNLITRIEASQPSNTRLKNKTLIQLDTLLDALAIQLTNQYLDSHQVQLLSKVEKQLTSIVTMLMPLNLQTSLGVFEQLRQKVDEIFVTDYAKKIANQPGERQSLADIVRDLIRFEDLILTAGLLVKWQGSLRLMADYQQQLVSQQQQLHRILASVLANPVINHNVSADIDVITNKQLSIWQLCVFIASLASIFVLLCLVRIKIKLVNQYSVNCIGRALDGAQLPINDSSNAMAFNKYRFATEETEQLIKKIQQIKASNYSEIEYLALSDKNQQLEELIVNNKATQEQLKLELALNKVKTSQDYQIQILLEQQRGKTLYSTVIKQLVLLGSSATIHTSSEHEPGAEENYLYHAHQQGRDLVRKLRQASCYRYWQSSDAVLTLSDVNLVALIQAVLFNLENKLLLDKNTLRLNLDKNIIAEVNLDAELFVEMFRIFIRLLFSQKTESELALNLRLVDKNNGQEEICFTGHVNATGEIRQLPPVLQSFNDESAEQSEIGEYFNSLLRYQHGHNVSANLTEQGYQLSFTLPLAVTNSKQQESHPILSLPGYVTGIEQACTALAAKYIAMPIEVLLAVKSPNKYQRLQQLLQAMGLQTTFVSCELMLQENWQSGRFAVLLTEINCQAFTHFMVDEGDKTSENLALKRGVFSLDSSVVLANKTEAYAHWLVGELTANSSIDDLIIAMQPWLNEQVSDAFSSNNKSQVIPVKSFAFSDQQAESTLSATMADSPSFNFDRYVQHQGTAEIALYMLEEYTAENSELVAQLSQAFTMNDDKNVALAIQALGVNGKILAAEYLLQLCQRWQTLLSNQELDNSAQRQINLLSKTKQAVQAISQDAEAIA